MTITIYHNPACGTSRNVLTILQAAGAAPIVVEYLSAGWSRAQLQDLFAAAGISARDALRISGTPAQELGLTDPGIGDDALITAMIAHPVLVNRPFVCTPRGVRLCRPSDQVLDLLDVWPPGPFAREDGTLLIDESGARVGG